MTRRAAPLALALAIACGRFDLDGQLYACAEGRCTSGFRCVELTAAEREKTGGAQRDVCVREACEVDADCRLRSCNGGHCGCRPGDCPGFCNAFTGICDACSPRCDSAGAPDGCGGFCGGT